MGMWDALHWSVTFKRDQSFLGKPENKVRKRFHIPNFPEGLRGGIIAFPQSAKETIALRFHNSFPDDLYDCVFFVIDSLIDTVGRNQKKEKAFSPTDQKRRCHLVCYCKEIGRIQRRRKCSMKIAIVWTSLA